MCTLKTLVTDYNSTLPYSENKISVIDEARSTRFKLVTAAIILRFRVLTLTKGNKTKITFRLHAVL